MGSMTPAGVEKRMKSMGVDARRTIIKHQPEGPHSFCRALPSLDDTAVTAVSRKLPRKSCTV